MLTRATDSIFPLAVANESMHFFSFSINLGAVSSIVTILEGAEVRIGFYGRGGRDPPRGHSRGCRRPRGVAPRLIPTSEVRKIL